MIGYENKAFEDAMNCMIDGNCISNYPKDGYCVANDEDGDKNDDGDGDDAGIHAEPSVGRRGA